MEYSGMTVALVIANIFVAGWMINQRQFILARLVIFANAFHVFYPAVAMVGGSSGKMLMLGLGFFYIGYAVAQIRRMK